MYEIFEKLCTERNVTPYKVCKETGITTSTISSWKAGRYVPKQEKLQKIADFFGVSLEYLMTGEENDKPTPFTKDELKLLERINHLNAENRERLELYMNELFEFQATQERLERLLKSQGKQ